MSSTANVVAIRPIEHDAADRLAELLKMRAELEAEFRQVSKPEATRASAAASIGSIEVEIRAMDEAERATWITWADDPTKEPPIAQQDERRELERRRALLAADMRGAEAACAAVQGRLSEISTKLRQLATQIYAARLEIVLAQIPEIERKILDAHRIKTEQVMNLQALFLTLLDEKALAMSRGDEAVSGMLQSAIGQIENLKPPGPTIDHNKMAADTARWREALR